VLALLALLFTAVSSAACTMGANVLENDLDALQLEIDDEAESLRWRTRRTDDDDEAETLRRRGRGRPAVNPALHQFGQAVNPALHQFGQAVNRFGQHIGRHLPHMPITSRAIADVRNEATRRGIGHGGHHNGVTISTKSGRVQITSQDQTIAKELCLHEVAYCYIDCPNTFKLDCAVKNAQIYSIRVSVKEHEAKCVAPRVAAGEKRENCYYSACSCDVYEKWFNRVVGPAELTEAFEKTRQQCMTWCTTGVQPSTVWNKTQFKQKMSVGKKIGRAFKKVGRAIKKVAKKIGRAFKRVFGRRRR